MPKEVFYSGVNRKRVGRGPAQEKTKSYLWLREPRKNQGQRRPAVCSHWNAGRLAAGSKGRPSKSGPGGYDPAFLMVMVRPGPCSDLRTTRT